MRKNLGAMVLGLALAGWGGIPLTAQTVITSDEAVRIAIERNLSLQRTSWDLESKKRQSDHAWGVFIPSVSLTSGLSRPNEGQTVLGVTNDPVSTYSQSLSLSLSISGSLLSDLATVSLNYRSGLVSYDQAKRSLEKSVRQAFASLILEQENLKLSLDTIQRREKSLADTQAKYKNGLAPELDVLSARVSLESLRPSYQRLQTTYENDLGNLKALLGIPLDQELVLQGSLDLPLEQNLNLVNDSGVVTVSPEVVQAQLVLDAAALSLESKQWASWLPTLSLSWKTAPSISLQDNAEWADSQGALSVQLSYSLDSWIPWTSHREQLNQAEEKLKASRSQLEETKTNSALKRMNYLRQIQQSVKSLETQLLNVELAQKTYDLSLDAYRRGTKDLSALQNSEGDLNQARYDVLSQRYTLASTILELEYELNVPFGTLLGGKE